MIRWKRSWPELSENLPLDVLPCSNGEYMPGEPTRAQRAIMELAREECDKTARKLGMSRRSFLRTSAATAICLMAIDRVRGTQAYAQVDTSSISNPNPACKGDVAQLANQPPGEFIMDLQTHHIDSGGMWRVTNPAFEAFFAAVWSQDNCGELDRIECLSRYYYIKELFLDSETDVCVLSAVPSPPDQQLLPTDLAANTVQIVNGLANSQRCVMHAFVMPNRGSVAMSYNPGGNSICSAAGTTAGPSGAMPLFMQDEFDRMEAAAAQYKSILRAWKIYTPWGDAPNTSGWWLDDPVGLAFLQQVKSVGNTYGVPKMVCAHKGFALPGFDQRTAATRDVGVVASMPDFQDVTFIIYHSGYDTVASLANPQGLGKSSGPYPDANEQPSPTFPASDYSYTSESSISSCDRGVLNFIKALRENHWDAESNKGKLAFNPYGTTKGNVPNVYAELGSVFRDYASNPVNATYLLCNLFKYVGPKRVCWGTDSLWYGSPQSLIQAFRALDMTNVTDSSGNIICQNPFYNIPYGMDGDVDEPTIDTRVGSNYLTQYRGIPSWPTDGRPHLERSIRNGVFGRNAAVPYRVDPDATLSAIKCDDVQKIRNQYIVNPLAANKVYGPRTRRELFAMLREDPWWRGDGLYYKGKKIG